MWIVNQKRNRSYKFICIWVTDEYKDKDTRDICITYSCGDNEDFWDVVGTYNNKRAEEVYLDIIENKLCEVKKIFMPVK